MITAIAVSLRQGDKVRTRRVGLAAIAPRVVPRAPSLALCVVLFASVATLEAQTVELTIVNETGASIFFLYASPSSTDRWGEDLLGRSVLADGSTFRVRFSSTDDRYDIRAVDAAENEYIVWGWLREGDSRVYLTRETFVGNRANVSDSRAVSWITIANETNYTVHEIRVRPSGEDRWDQARQFLLDDQVMYFGENLTIRIDVELHGTYLYDVMLVDADGDRYIVAGVDLQTVAQLVFTLDDMVW